MTIYGCGYTYIHTDQTRLLKGFRSGPEGHIDEAIFSGYTAYSPHSFPVVNVLPGSVYRENSFITEIANLETYVLQAVVISG